MSAEAKNVLTGKIPTLPVVDKTLKRAGYSADAKATGEAIAENNKKIDVKHEELREELDIERKRIDESRGLIDQIANNQIPEEYLEEAVDKYVEENSAGFATQASLEAVETDLKSELSKVENTILQKGGYMKCDENTFPCVEKFGAYINGAGEYVEQELFKSYEMTVDADRNIYFKDTQQYVCLAVYNGEVGSENYIDRYREDTLPTETNPYRLVKGQTIVISITYSEPLKFYCDNISGAESFKEDILFNSKDKMILKNEITSAYHKVTCFFTNGAHLIGIDLWKYKNASINADVWAMGGVYKYDNGFNVIDTIILPVEWDCAIKEVGASDFMGGKMHGDENFVEFNIFVDGKTFDTNVVTDTIYCDKVELVQLSILNRCDTPNDNLLNHVKHIVIEQDSIFCEQSFKALQDFVVELGYTGMLPVAPNYASKFIRNKKCEYEDINGEGYVQNNTRGRHQWANITSDNGNIRFECDSDSEYEPIFSITNGSNDHKCYYSINNNRVTWESGKIITTMYKVDFSLN